MEETVDVHCSLCKYIFQDKRKLCSQGGNLPRRSEIEFKIIQHPGFAIYSWGEKERVQSSNYNLVKEQFDKISMWETSRFSFIHLILHTFLWERSELLCHRIIIVSFYLSLFWFFLFSFDVAHLWFRFMLTLPLLIKFSL